MAFNRSQLAEACDTGSKGSIDLLLTSGTRLPLTDGRAIFLKIIASIKNLEFRDELLTAFIRHFKPSKNSFLTQQATAWYSFLILAIKYNDEAIIFTACEKLYANPALYYEMKQQALSNKVRFLKVIDEANEIYSVLLQNRAETLIKKFENSYFFKKQDEMQITPTIQRINEYFKIPDTSYNTDLRLARNQLAQYKTQLLKHNRNMKAQQNSPWKQLTDISYRLNFSIFNRRAANPHGAPGDQRLKSLNITKL